MSDQELFDPSDVTWDIEKSKRRDQIKIVLTSADGSPMSVLKTYLALLMICEKIEIEMNIMPAADGSQ